MSETAENEESGLGSLALGRGLRLLQVELIKESGEQEVFDLSLSPVTFITGPRNSSKTTTLKVVDYCFGSGHTPSHALGPAIEAKYQAVAVEISIDGHFHRLVRDFRQGHRTKVAVDGTEIDVQELSRWMLQQLGWPSLTIPKGVNPSTARDQIALSFRAMLRHIYRREDSWTEFAAREEEYYRRAVVSLFLGFAPQRYESAAFDLGRAVRKLAEEQAAYREASETARATILTLTRQLGLPAVIDVESLQSVRVELERNLRNANTIRDSIARAAAEAAAGAEVEFGVDTELASHLEMSTQDVAEGAGRLSSLRVVLAEHRRSHDNVRGEIQRLQRLEDSLDVFEQLPVRTCPACEQAIADREHTHGDCYVCGQEVTEDIRRRRADREVRALQSELDDITEAIQRTEIEEVAVTRAYADADAIRVHLTKRLQDSRVVALAPFMAQLEDAATAIGRIRQQIVALPALGSILAREGFAAKNVVAAEREYERLRNLADEESRQATDASTRCAQFADSMNDFLANFNDRVWVGSQITISASDLTFYAATGTWDAKLGAEARVLFFLAYSYALIRLSALDDSRVCPPGVLLLDNPYQQDVSDDVIRDALRLIGEAAVAAGAQVIVAQSRSAAGINVAHQEIRMTKIYDDRPAVEGR